MLNAAPLDGTDVDATALRSPRALDVARRRADARAGVHRGARGAEPVPAVSARCTACEARVSVEVFRNDLARVEVGGPRLRARTATEVRERQIVEEPVARAHGMVPVRALADPVKDVSVGDVVGDHGSGVPHGRRAAVARPDQDARAPVHHREVVRDAQLSRRVPARDPVTERPRDDVVDDRHARHRGVDAMHGSAGAITRARADVLHYVA